MRAYPLKPPDPKTARGLQTPTSFELTIHQKHLELALKPEVHISFKHALVKHFSWEVLVPASRRSAIQDLLLPEPWLELAEAILVIVVDAFPICIVCVSILFL